MIYDKFFGFKEEPFGVTPDPKFLYMSKKHEDALAHLKFGLSENKGFVMLTGEVGSGKTTLIRYLLEHFGPDTHTSLVINPMVNPLELFKLIIHDFGISFSGTTQKDYLNALNNFLLDAFLKHEKAVLVIDEAQELSNECLEFIRLLSNLETNTKKLLQVVLVGQPQLKEIVASESLKQLDQRIAVRYHLEPLDTNDTVVYIKHRLKIAGGKDVAFPEGSIKFIHKYSRGIPRLINLACDRTLLLAYSESKKDVSFNFVKKALKDLGSASVKKEMNFLRTAVISAGMLIIIIALAYQNISHEENYFGKMSGMMKDVKTDGDFFINDGIYMVSKNDLSEAACILNALNIWEEKDLSLNADMLKETEKRGFSSYRFVADIEKVIKLNMPCILYIKQNKMESCAVLRWVVGNDAMVIDPLSGKNILPVNAFKDKITGVNILYKNRYNGTDKIALLQRELKQRHFYKYSVTGKMDSRTKEALINFQKKERLEPTGMLDDETKIVLSVSVNEKTPSLFPE